MILSKCRIREAFGRISGRITATKSVIPIFSDPCDLVPDEFWGGRTMKKGISLVICLLALASGSAVQVKARILNQKSDEAAIRELLLIHKKFIEVTSKGDSDGMGMLVADDYSVIGVDGQKADKTKALEAVKKNGGVVVVVMEETDLSARLIDGAGIVTGLISWKAGPPENEVKGKVRFTEVWRKENRTWKLVVSQATNVVSG